MAENTLTIKVGQVELTCHGDQEWIGRQLDEILRAVARHAPACLGPAGVESAGPPSPAALLARSRARTFGEKAGVVAFWLQEHGGRARWRSGEITDVLRRTDDKAPTNITDALNHKLRMGFFATEDRMWWLTEPGRYWVLHTLLSDEDEDAPPDDP